MHNLEVITLLAGALGVALLFGALTQRVGLSTLVGYLLAGIAVGPHTPGFVANPELASQMAEIGVIVLMFGVGLHFHPGALLRVGRIAIPGAIGQTAVAAVAGWGLARLFGWGHASGAVLGMALGVASTVVLTKMLLERRRLTTHDGYLAIGWLVVEDLFTVAVLVALPIIAAHGAGSSTLGTSLAIALGKVVVFAALVWLAGTRLIGRLLARVARTRSSELFTLTVFIVALGIAVIASEIFSVSVALGAFFAGLVVGQSRFGPQAAADMAPFRDVFSALFFVSVGMLFDPAFVLREPLLVAGAVVIVVMIKPLVAYAIVRGLGDTPRTAATVAVGLAQIGEFSFILGGLATSLGLLPPDGMAALVAAAIASISLNPVLFRLAERWLPMALVPARASNGSRPPLGPNGREARTTQIIVAGGGLVARSAVSRLAALGAVCVQVDPDLAVVPEAAEPLSHRVVSGDPACDEVLLAAGARDARVLVASGLELPDVMRLCMTARRLNPQIEIVAAAASPAEYAWLKEFGARHICDAVDEQAAQLAELARRI